MQPLLDTLFRHFVERNPLPPPPLHLKQALIRMVLLSPSQGRGAGTDPEPAWRGGWEQGITFRLLSGAKGGFWATHGGSSRGPGLGPFFTTDLARPSSSHVDRSIQTPRPSARPVPRVAAIRFRPHSLSPSPSTHPLVPSLRSSRSLSSDRELDFNSLTRP